MTPRQRRRLGAMNVERAELAAALRNPELAPFEQYEPGCCKVTRGLAQPRPAPTLTAADIAECRAIVKRLMLPAGDRKRVPGKRYVCRGEVSWGGGA